MAFSFVLFYRCRFFNLVLTRAAIRPHFKHMQSLKWWAMILDDASLCNVGSVSGSQ